MLGMRLGSCRFSALAVSFYLALMPLAAEAAESFSLTNGSVITGDVVGEANGVLSIRTQYGVINVPLADIVSRQAIAPAPSAQPLASDRPLRLQGSNTIGSRLIVDLLRGYTAARGFAADFVEIGGPTPEDKVFKATNAGGQAFNISVGSHGSGTAFKELAASNADIGMSSRRINDKEVADLRALGVGTLTDPGLEHVLALDGLAVIVHPDNPLKSLSLKQIADIFGGTITDWGQVGPFSGPIHIFRRDAKSGTYDSFKSMVMSGKDVVETSKEFESSDELSGGVASDPLGIGFIGFAYIGNAKPLDISQSCGLTSGPSEYSIKAEEYPLSRRLYLYNPTQQRHLNAVDFVDYALSNDAQPIIKDAGFINLSPEASDDAYRDEAIRRAVLLADAGDTRLADLQHFAGLVSTGNGSRLSITFRFNSGSSNLDNRALRDLDRLADYWKALKARKPASRLVVLGFTDSIGRFDKNALLSKSRAEAVARGLTERAVQPDLLDGLGELAPVACDDSDAGLAKNRRVEIWVF